MFDIYSIGTTNTGTQSWTDFGSPIIEGFNNGSFIAAVNLTAQRSLNVGLGSAITSSGTGGTMAASGPNGVSAGSCTTGLSGSCGHTFAAPYSATPVCTTTGTSVAASSSTVTVYALRGTTVNWICYPQTN